jgi:membrane protease YdiL (CAAX protease family)
MGTCREAIGTYDVGIVSSSVFLVLIMYASTYYRSGCDLKNSSFDVVLISSEELIFRGLL